MPITAKAEDKKYTMINGGLWLSTDGYYWLDSGPNGYLKYEGPYPSATEAGIAKLSAEGGGCNVDL